MKDLKFELNGKTVALMVVILGAILVMVIFLANVLSGGSPNPETTDFLSTPLSELTFGHILLLVLIVVFFLPFPKD